MKAPAFQFYPHDFLVGTADLTAEEVGGYIRLLCYQWAKGSLPNDDKKLMQLSGITDGLSLGNVSVKFRLCDDGLKRNDRLEKVRLEQQEYRRKQSENGQKGGNPNFKPGNPNPYYKKDNPQDNPKINSSSSSSSSPSSITTKKEGFKKPEPSQVEEYAKTIDFKVDGEHFCAYYETRGWKLSNGVSMKDWRSAVVTWKKGAFAKNGSKPHQPVKLRIPSQEELPHGN